MAEYLLAISGDQRPDRVRRLHENCGLRCTHDGTRRREAQFPVPVIAHGRETARPAAQCSLPMWWRSEAKAVLPDRSECDLRAQN